MSLKDVNEKIFGEEGTLVDISVKKASTQVTRIALLYKIEA